MSESDDDLGFRINKSYAQKYDTWRRKEEYQKLKDKYGEDVLESSSSSEVEDDDAQEITPQFEKQFLRALASVKSRDPKIYDKGVKFFDDEDKSKEDSAEGDQKSKPKKGKEKPMYLKDYERKIIVEKGGKFSDDEDEDEGGILDNFDEGMSVSPSYMEEQKEIKDSFQEALKDIDDSSDDEAFLTKKKKTKEEKEQEEEEYIQWLKGEKEELTKEDVRKEAKDVDSLRDYWSNPQLDEGEKFLRDYILDKAYKPTGDENEFENLSEEDLSEDDRLLDEQEDFERKFNFRYEEPDSEFVRSYPRNIEGSMRRKDTSRAKKRQEVKERKEKEKQKLHEELKKLKNLKKMEILEQLEKLKKVTGNATVGFDEDDIKGDFDPNKHDELMKKIFNEEYDDLDEDKTKPVFEDEEFEEENWDEWTGYDDGYYETEENLKGSQAHCEDADFIMDADYDPEIHKKEKKKKKKKDKEKKNKETTEPTPVKSRDDLDGRRPRNKHTSEFAKALQEEKPVFDPEDETFEEYFDEYYKLDYEDLIGDLPCRFKYRTVVANDFGLTPEEVLGADDKELNRWVSLKRTYQYRTKNEEFSDLHSFKEKGNNIYKKKQVLQSLYQPREDEEPEGEVVEEEEDVKGEEEVEEEAGNVRDEAGEDVDVEDQSIESSNKKKKKKKKEKKTREDMEENRDVGEQRSNIVMTTEVMTTEGEGEGETNGQKKFNERVQMEERQDDRGAVAEQGPSRTKGAGKRKFIEEMRNRKRRKMARKKEISEGRLKAYGVKPKAYKYKMIQNRIRDKKMKKVR